MTEFGSTLTRHAASLRGYRGRQNIMAAIVRRFRKPIVASALVLGDVGAAIVAISLSRALTAATGLEPPNAKHLPIALLILTLFCFRLYTGNGPGPFERFRMRGLGVLTFVAIDFVNGLAADALGPFLVAGAGTALLQWILLTIFGHYVEAVIRTLLIRLDLWGAPTALVGRGDNSRKLAHLLLSEPELGLTPIGFIENASDEVSPQAPFPLPALGASAEPDRVDTQLEFVIFNSADEFVAVTSNPQRWMSTCGHLVVRDGNDTSSLHSRSRLLGGTIGFEIRNDLRKRRDVLFKRLIDILLAVPIAVFVAPIIIILALAIKLVDSGPAFYVQKRVGANAAPLRMFKLRTMYADAEQRLNGHLSQDPQARAEWQRFFKLSHDPRVLPIIGDLMRRTSLDELPQLWNVILGEMSLVGPRPFPAYHMGCFDEEFQALRVSVPPGITGMWQVSSRSNGDLEVQKTQDLFYIKNWSLWLDMYILLQTVPAVLSVKGAR